MLKYFNIQIIDMQKFSDGTKYCPKCGCAKTETDFHKDKTTADGLMTMCKKCKREYRLSPFYKTREHELEKLPEWKARKTKYAKTPKGKHYNSIESHNGYIKKYETKVINTLTFVEWKCILVLQDNKCAICMCEFTETNKAVRDCIIPLVKGGSLTFDNTQALCDHCNSVKNTRVYSGLGNRWRSVF